ncbi:MAG: NAD(P)/FAD-dependent oxidoreductase, partial [Thermoanaerobaculia bacterium]
MSERPDAAGGRTAIIVGAGPAGLTAAYELLEHTDVKPIVLEQSDLMGGLSCTVDYKGNRIDIGGHRFFSKADRVMEWWLDVLPLQALPEGSGRITYHKRSRDVTTGDGPDPETTDRVMLLRSRKSRIYYLRQFFDYPINLSIDTLRKLGLVRTIRIGLSYVWSVVVPKRAPRNLEEFFIQRFGKELYLTFFKSYTEKVWGTRCRDISAEWGAQRIKGLSITRAVLHFLKQLLPQKKDIAQKGTETSLIEQFLYPKLGPGQMWDVVAEKIRERGGEIRTGWLVERFLTDGNRLRAVEAVDRDSGEKRTFDGDFFFSSMPVQGLVAGLDGEVPEAAAEVARGLVYRDFITVGLLVDKLRVGDIRDNWIYIQEPDVLVGRLQIFNNWSPYMVADRDKMWIGLEYFCNDTDELWNKSDEDMIALAEEELDRIEIIDRRDVLDGVVIRMPKTYPAYFGTYDRFGELQAFLDGFDNLFLVGRNGMHKYNNQDHAML